MRPVNPGVETTLLSLPGKRGAEEVPAGLSSAEAARRRAEFGPNAVPEERPSPVRSIAAKFWEPIPWLLEAAIVLQAGLGGYIEAAVIAGLLLFNATLGFLQESRANEAVAALRSRLAPNALVRRDGI